MAFALVKKDWAKLDAKKLMTEGPPEGKEHHRPSSILTVSWRDLALWRSNVRRMSYSHEKFFIILSCNMER